MEKCAFGKCYGKKMGQSGACEKHSGLEVNSNVDKVNSDLTEQLDEKRLSRLEKCEYCNSQVNVDMMKVGLPLFFVCGSQNLAGTFQWYVIYLTPHP